MEFHCSLGCFFGKLLVGRIEPREVGVPCAAAVELRSVFALRPSLPRPSHSLVAAA